MSGPLVAALRAADRAVFRRLYDHYPRALEREIAPSCRTLLDVGCGPRSPIAPFAHALERTVGVDAFEESVRTSHAVGIHTEYRVLEALEIGECFPARSFDAVLASDVIEHFPKADSLRLLTIMERIARVKVLVLTPRGFLPQAAYEGNRLQEHLSGWEVEEMRTLGYRVRGICGWKPLRGERGGIAWRPRPVWARISALSQLVTARRPEWAFEMLCVKDLR